MIPENDQVTIEMSDYVELLGDRTLLIELEKLGLTKLDIYDTAFMNAFLSTSRRYDGGSKEESKRESFGTEKAPFGQAT